jgi:hypothetical protein
MSSPEFAEAQLEKLYKEFKESKEALVLENIAQQYEDKELTSVELMRKNINYAFTGLDADMPSTEFLRFIKDTFQPLLEQERKATFYAMAHYFQAKQ